MSSRNCNVRRHMPVFLLWETSVNSWPSVRAPRIFEVVLWAFSIMDSAREVARAVGRRGLRSENARLVIWAEGAEERAISLL